MTIFKFTNILSGPKKPRKFVAQKGWVEIDGRNIYFKSKWEAQCAKHLQGMKEAQRIHDWAYEPKIFRFEGITKGCTTYTPDFKVTNLEGKILWIEVKGYMDAKSKTKLKRFSIYFPNEKLLLIEDRNFLKINLEIDRL